MTVTGEEVQARIARKSTKALITDLRNGRARIAMELNARKRRDLVQVYKWVRGELLLRFPVAKQAVQAAHTAAITKIEKRGLDYDSILIDAIPVSERGSDMPPSPRGLTTPQKELLVTLLGWYRESRVHGHSDRPQPRELGSYQINTARVLTRYGYLKADGRAYWYDFRSAQDGHTYWFDFRFTEQGLRVAEQLYADLGMDANVIYVAEPLGPADITGPDDRPAGRVVAAAAAFVNDPSVFREGASSAYSQPAWWCLLCDNGHRFTDRVEHWQWHQRLAATVDAIDWANPVVTQGDQE